MEYIITIPLSFYIYIKHNQMESIHFIELAFDAMNV
jgi:hypothetical protein